jgi:glutamate-5-semialdehyde dehydrogenase
MSHVTDLAEYCRGLGCRAREAARALATASGARKDHWLRLAAAEIRRQQGALLTANAQDLRQAEGAGLTAAQIDRLRLTPDRVEALAAGLDAVAGLPDPVGKVLDGQVRPNGLEIRKVAVPLGVILFIYESRPNVTADAAALAVKSGNAIILRGGKEALHSNRAIHTTLRGALAETGLPVDAVQLVETTDRDAVNHLLALAEFIDLAIPRGGEGLIRLVAERAKMPVLKHYQGNCHVYVDCAADLAMAEKVLLNAKCQRPGVCNAAESLLVHEAVAGEFLPRAVAALRGQGVEVRACELTRQIVAARDPDLARPLVPAAEADWSTEYLDLIISVKIVDSLQEAIAHINRFGSHHTDAIVTGDLAAAREFVAGVDSAAVMVNASTRFHDGFEFGLGAEIGISTDKFHARGPCGLLELTTYKYIVFGDGQTRG